MSKVSPLFRIFRLPSADRPSNRVEIMIGRGLAMSVHPSLAWQLLPPKKRALLVLGYFGLSYVTVLAGLQMFGAAG
jgi:hypothetical protein